MRCFTFPSFGISSDRRGPLSKLTARFRGEIFTKPGTQRWYEKGRKRGGGGWEASQKSGVIQHKSACGSISSKRGECLCECAHFGANWATGILGLLRVKTPQKAFQHLSINFFASATFYLFLFVFAQSYNHFYVQFGQINTNTQLENATYPHIGTTEYVKSSVTPIKKDIYHYSQGNQQKVHRTFLAWSQSG